jgi:hypothetical protein
MLLLILVVVGLGLAALLWVGTLFLQGYIYSEPVPELYWRAPAAAGALTLFLAVWCFLDSRFALPGAREQPLDTWYSFSPSETYPAEPYRHFWSVRKGKETEYVYDKTAPSGSRYRDTTSARLPWKREAAGEGIVDTIVLEEDGQKARFKLDLPPGGKFGPEGARYVEEGGKGRVVTEEVLARGQFTYFRWGLFLTYAVLNVLHLVVWFVCLWLLLRYQWSHALGLAVVLWLIMTLAILPLVVGRVPLPPPPTRATTAWHGPTGPRFIRVCHVAPSGVSAPRAARG